MSEMYIQFQFAVCALAVMMVLAHAQDQSSDFISIDCGLQQNLDYTQSTTTIRYTPDANYITTGEVRAISRANNPAQQFWFVRVFPEGTRNCYKINIRSGQKYLIRASFMYGNYDGDNNAPEFELHLGADLWDSVAVTAEIDTIIKELIHVPVRDYIHICLVNVGKGVPFISAIEIRRLRFDAYRTEVGSSLALVNRINMALNETVYRYPSDAYDRIWTHQFPDRWDELIVDPTTPIKADQSSFELPSDVMSTAAMPSFPATNLNLSWAPAAGVVDKNSSYFIYMHFAEIEDLIKPRGLAVSVNGETIAKLFDPVYLETTTKNSSIAADLGGYYFSVDSDNLGHGPFLNAYEIYIEKNLMASETNQQDVEAITNIKSSYNIVKNWQGDPCNPRAYLWEGVNCSYSENNSSRIISLDLSSSGLTGDIADSIANLTMIQILDLSDNKLSGQIPEYLSNLSKLNLINFDQNELTGSVPAGLIAKTNDGLSLSLCGNPSLTGTVPCVKKKKKKFLIPIFASIIVMLLVSSTAAAKLWKSKRFNRYLVLWNIVPESSVSDLEIAKNREGRVFLSFRGKDTRQFARNLYEALKKREFKTFFDDKTLKKGDRIADALFKAIGASDISIVLFSENYVTSSWCLNELEKIVECKTSTGQHVIPVFYKVDPADVRYQLGSFSLKKWTDRNNIKVSKWKEALHEVANLSGVTHIEGGYEFDKIEEIVEATLDAMEEKREKSMERFDRKFPPGGEDEIVIYVTNKVKDKNFKNCESVMTSLREFKLKNVQERDVTIRKFRRELKKLMRKTVAPPRLFVKGKYVGGYDEVSRLMKEPWFCDALNEYSENPAMNEVSLHGQGVVVVQQKEEEAGAASETDQNVEGVMVRVFDRSTGFQTSKRNAGITRSVTIV